MAALRVTGKGLDLKLCGMMSVPDADRAVQIR